MEDVRQTQVDTKGEPPAYGEGTHLPTPTAAPTPTTAPTPTAAPTSAPAAVDPQLHLKPTNFLYINGDYRVKSAYIIDPSLRIQKEYLPPLKNANFWGGVGKKTLNMYIHTTGDLDLGLWIVGRKDSDVALDPMKRTRMYVGSRSGSLFIKVVRCAACRSLLETPNTNIWVRTQLTISTPSPSTLSLKTNL